MATKRLTTTNIDYKTMLGKMSVTERLRLAQSQDGPSILANVDPSQLPGLFPRYYQEKLPDVGEALKSVMSKEFKPVGPPVGGIADVRTGGSYFDPKTGNRISAIQSKTLAARLSNDQKAILEQLRSGSIASDDPRVGFINNLSDDERKKVGIEKVQGDGGKESYKMTAIEPSQEEVEVARKNPQMTGKSNKEIIQRAFADELRKKGVEEANIPYAVAALSGQVQVESGFNPDAKHDKDPRTGEYTGYGIYGARDPKPGIGRKTGMLKWLEENGYDKNSAEGQGRYMVHEAFSGKYAGSANALRNANKDNIKDVTSVLTTEFENPAEKTQNIINRTSIANQEVNNGISAARSYDLGPEASDDQIKSAIVKRKQGRQEQELADIVESKKQAGPTATPDNRSTGVYTAGDSIGVGVGQSTKIPTVAQGGLMFTDPRMVQQLKNVPNGSTVQLYAGTNDAASGRLDSKAYEARMAELKQIAEERGLNVSIHGPHQSPNKKWSGNVGTVNQMLGDTARNSGFKYVDNSSVTADAPDGIHMSSKAYQELYNRSLPAAPAEPEAIPAMAEGGDLNVNEGEIKALPIGAMKNDNSVVVDKDSKPLFTMNTKEESANYNPDTGKVSVDPNAKKENDGNQELSLDQQSTFKQSQVPISESSGMSSFDTTLTLTDNMFKDPSFHRAMSRARFDISGDSASGNHFSSSATVS